MKLYFTPGTCSLGPHIVLREIGAPFELERVDFPTKTTDAGRDYRQVNPAGNVPALETGGEIVTEGPAIVQFIADRHGAADLAPASGTLGRARVQEVLNFVCAELHAAFGPLFAPNLPPEARAAQVATVGRKLDRLEALLGDGRPFLCGPSYTVADAYSFAVVGWSRLHDIPLVPWPRLAAWLARVAARPAVRAALAAEARAA